MSDFGVIPMSDREIMISVLARVVNIDNSVTDIKREMLDKADKETVAGLTRKLEELDRDTNLMFKSIEKESQAIRNKLYWFSGATAAVAALFEVVFGFKK